MTVTLKEISHAIEQGKMALVGETAGYLILGAADSAMKEQRLTELTTITLSAEGLIILTGPDADDLRVEASLRASLSRLLSLCRREHPNLQRVANRPDMRGLESLIGELEAALVPVNRKAARRSLSRLFREAKRLRASLALMVNPTESAAVELAASAAVKSAMAESAGLAAVESATAALAAADSVGLAAAESAIAELAGLAAAESATAESNSSWIESVLHSRIPSETPTRVTPFFKIETKEVLSSSVTGEARLTAAEQEFRSMSEIAESHELSVSSREQPEVLEREPDEAETEIFTSVVSCLPSQTQSVSQQTPKPKVTAPVERTSVGAFGWSSKDYVEQNESLITFNDVEEPRTQSLNELLDAMQPPRPSSRLMRELRKFSEVEHSPSPPEIK